MERPDSHATPEQAAEALLAEVPRHRLPNHVAVIMDGNGRWARRQGLPRVEGHRAGIRAVRDTVETAARLGLQALTLYAFSTENWKRPRWEVQTLMGLLKEYLTKELNLLTENNIRFRAIGRIGEMEPEIQQGLHRAEQATAENGGMVFQIALNYSGRAELVDTVRTAVALAQEGRLTVDQVNEDWMSSHLTTAGVADPDLLIRTSGEQRISNFLLWQIAYAELFITPVLWPDFTGAHFTEGLAVYAQRERRFGGVLEDGQDPEPDGGGSR